MRRRDFIAGLGGAGAWPLAGRAQQARIPVIGFLAVGPNDAKRWGPSFPQGLTEAGYVEGQNLAIEYRGGPPRIDRLRELATELVRRQVAAILTSNDGPAVAAKRASLLSDIVRRATAAAIVVDHHSAHGIGRRRRRRDSGGPMQSFS